MKWLYACLLYFFHIIHKHLQNCLSIIFLPYCLYWMNIKTSLINAAWLTKRVRCGALWKAVKAVSELAAVHLPFAVKRDSTFGSCGLTIHI